jgi:superfamily I DNA/RNA helicase
VHALANRWVKKISNRAEKEYRPRDADGEVIYLDESTSRCPIQMVDAIERDLAEGRSVMVLAACSFMLQKTIAEMRARGIAFHNEYRTNRGDWNPLKRSKGATPVRLEAYLRRNPEFAPSEGEAVLHIWTAREMNLICEHLSGDVLVRGAKAELKRMIADKALKDQFVDEARFVHADHLAWLRQGLLEPFLENLLGSKRKSFDYAAAIVRRGGLNALEEDPKVTIGTVHSVKGGEASSVYLFPDLSPEGDRRWGGSQKGRDDVRRLFYVGFTRARERLTLCRNVGEAAVQWSA